MYNPHITDNSNVIIQETHKGLGVFATKDIPARTLIAEFIGKVYMSDLATEVPARMVDHVIQIGQTTFLHAENRLAEFINHSCRPNCGIKNLTQVVTTVPIKIGDEVTWDYRCSENSNWVLENCLCGADRCTGIVGNFDSLPEVIKKEYLTNGMVSEWITAP